MKKGISSVKGITHPPSELKKSQIMAVICSLQLRADSLHILRITDFPTDSHYAQVTQSNNF